MRKFHTTRTVAGLTLATSLLALQAHAEGVTLTVWHSSADLPAVLSLYKAYEAASGNKIELVDIPADQFPTATQVKCASGERPDVLEYMPSPQDMRQLNAAENMQDLSGMGFAARQGNVSNIAGQLDGKTYAAVLGPLSTFGAFYSKDMMAAAGVEMPKSYAELPAYCEKVKAAGKVPVFVGAGSEFPANMLAGFAYMADFNVGDAFGAGVRDSKIKVNDPAGPIVASLTLIDGLRLAGCLNSDAATATFQDAVKAVTAGEAGITVLPSDFIAMFNEAGGGDLAAVGAKVGLAAISAEKGIPSIAAAPFGSFFAPKTGDEAREAAARDFINWATTEGYQAYLNEGKFVPTLEGFKAPDLTGLPADMAAMLANPEATPAFNKSIPGFGTFGKVSVSVVVGQASPQEAADKWATFVEQAILAQQ